MPICKTPLIGASGSPPSMRGGGGQESGIRLLWPLRATEFYGAGVEPKTCQCAAWALTVGAAHATWTGRVLRWRRCVGVSLWRYCAVQGVPCNWAEGGREPPLQPLRQSAPWACRAAVRDLRPPRCRAQPHALEGGSNTGGACTACSLFAGSASARRGRSPLRARWYCPRDTAETAAWHKVTVVLQVK